MGSLTNIGYSISNGTDSAPFTLVPAQQRNGVITLYGTESESGLDGFGALPDDSRMVASYSVRPGKPADLINGGKRVKRKFVAKVRVPVVVPAAVAGAVTDVIDYIDAEMTLATPVEAESHQIDNAVDFFSGTISAAWVEEMVKKGYEPF